MAKIILALDVDNFAKAKNIVNRLYPSIKIFKIGSQMFTAYGPKVVKYIHKKGGEVFLDLKFHDIPNTVANAVREAVRLKVKMLTMHASGGKEMLMAAVNSADSQAKKLKIKKPLLIGVTVLTSQEAKQNEVLKLVKLAKECGLDGAVCSVREAAVIRKKMGNKFIIVTPGIRLGTKDKADQKRIATPEEAVKKGSNYLVIGRPILEAENPAQVINKINKMRA